MLKWVERSKSFCRAAFCFETEIALFMDDLGGHRMADSERCPMASGKSCKLNVPKDVPVKKF